MEHQRRRGGQPGDLSRLFVYFNARRMSGRETMDCGSSIAQGMAALLAFGAPPESAWPYDPERYATEPDQAAFAAGLENVPAEYARVDGMDHVRGALARQHPVVFGTNLPERCYAEAGRDGRMPEPTATELDQARTRGGHAMLLVGYDLDQGTLLVRNSWGPDWGDKGYCTMSSATFEGSVRAGGAWILGKLEASGDFKVVRPAVTAPVVEGGVRGLSDRMVNDIRDNLMKDLEKSFKDIQDRMKPGQGR
jgi:hypothetical protein